MTHFRILLSVLVLTMTFPFTIVNASILAYNFTVDVNNGPLAGVIAHGSFTMSGDLSPPEGGDFLYSNDLLLSFEFEWNGILYDITNANNAGLRFSSEGEYELMAFGNNCAGSFCGFTSGVDHWSIVIGFEDLAGAMNYTLPGTTDFFSTPVIFTQVPIPPPFWLLGTAMIGMIRFSRQRSDL